ncbi:hypothetical protein [Mucilaginibacter segetis]|nr:hypothetical protein [Mucilaginibacter segetis]
MYALLLSLPAFMTFLSVLLEARLNRILNIIMGLFFTLVMLLVIAASIDRWMIFYIYLGAAEVIITSLITVYAWQWPKTEE